MSRYLVERYFPDGTGVLTGTVARAGAEANESVGVAWLYGYVIGDGYRVFSVYEAPDSEAIRKVTCCAGLSPQSIRRITALEPHPHG